MSNKNYRVSWAVKRNQIRRALAWKLRWQTQPELMRSNLDSLIKRNKDLGRKSREILNEYMSNAPRLIPTGEIRTIIKAQWLAKGYNLSPKEIETRRIKLWRKGLIKYDEPNAQWINFSCIE